MELKTKTNKKHQAHRGQTGGCQRQGDGDEGVDDEYHQRVQRAITRYEQGAQHSVVTARAFRTAHGELRYTHDLESENKINLKKGVKLKSFDHKKNSVTKNGDRY